MNLIEHIIINNDLLLFSVAVAAILIPTFAAMMYRFWGWLGMTLYLLFAVVCLIPSVIKYRKLKKEGKL